MKRFLLTLSLLVLPSSALAIRSGQFEPKVTYDAAFKDVPGVHHYIQAITWAKEQNVVGGYPDGTFKPEKEVSRIEFLKVVLEAAGIDASTELNPANFPDTDEDQWYSPYVRYAKKNGIVEGYPDGEFRPLKTVNFAEALKITYKVFNITAPQGGGIWYEPYLSHAKSNHFLFNEGIAVNSGVPRKDVVWIVWKIRQWQEAKGL